jgi:hypothetical protein
VQGCAARGTRVGDMMCVERRHFLEVQRFSVSPNPRKLFFLKLQI